MKPGEKNKYQNKAKNPFLPPYKESALISEDFPHHVIMFNKFYNYKYHSLVVTKKTHKQNDFLTVTDFIATVKVRNALNGIAYFNMGETSGRTQLHKHLQIIPLTPKVKDDFPLIGIIDDAVKKWKGITE
jgi:ATP adenylyltransferase